MKKILGGVAAISILASAGSAAAQVTTMFSDNFDGTSTTYAGVTVIRSGGGAVVDTNGTYGGASENIWHNDSVSPISATTWAVSGLGAHSQIIVDFDALFLDSWDSTNGSPAPDYFDIYFDNVLQLRMTSNNASGNVTAFGAGTSTFFGNIPVFNGSWNDRVVNLATSDLTISHTASSFLLRVEAGGSGWQGTTDESWGLDNLNISANLVQGGGAVPEPATWAMMITGFGAAGAVLRRRRTAAAAA